VRAPEPPVEVSVGVHPALRRLADPTEPVHDQVREALIEETDVLLDRLGLPGAPSVAIDTAPALEGTDSWIALSLNGTPCRYDRETSVAARTAALTTHDLDGGPPHEDGIVPWLEQASAEDRELAEAFFRAASPALLGDHATALVSPAVAAAYGATLGGQVDTGRLEVVLRHVVDLKVSVADRDRVGRVLVENLEQEPLDAAETLLAALRPRELELRLPESFLRELTTTEAESVPGLFTYLRDSLFRELGVPPPPLRPTRTDMPARTFSLTLNHLPLVPRLGLAPDECLVNDEPSRLRTMVSGLSEESVRGLAHNPGSGLPNTRIDLDDRDLAGAAGLTTWTPLGYVILAVAADLRRHARCLVDVAVARDLVGRLEYQAPALVREAHRRIPAPRLARVLRGLLAEQESCRNLPAILERLLDAESPQLASDRALNSWVRAALGPAIVTRQARGTGTVVVYLLDRSIEALLDGDGPPAEPAVGEVLAAIRQEIDLLPPNVGLPSLLTTDAVRLRLRELVSGEFPRLAVLSYEDLPPTVNVQPVARIVIPEPVGVGGPR
jgi:FHIPEP family